MPAFMLQRPLMLLAIAAVAALATPPAADGQATSRLRIGTPAVDGSLTPYTTDANYAFMSLVYDTLTWRDRQGIARPWLARSIRRQAGGRRVVVTLRAGVRWHDGTPLTANDVVFTYTYMAQRPHPRFTPQLQDIAGVSASSDLRVVFTLRRPTRGLEDQPFADVPIIPRHLWAGLNPARSAPAGRAVGTGPYRLTDYEPRRRYRLEANRDYFRGAPSVARVDVPVDRRQTVLLDDVRRERLDAAPVTVQPGAIPRRRGGTLYSDETSFAGTMLLFNLRRGPFTRVAARRAVADSLNLKALSGNASAVAGGTIPADRGMLHPRSRWAGRRSLHAFSPAAARLAFVEQGIGAFRVAAPRNDPVRLEVGRRVVRALVDAGARARLVELSPAALDRALGRRRAAASFDAAVLGFPALASYDPAYLRVVFGGDARMAPLNDGGYRSETFDALADRVASAPTMRRRRTAVDAQLRLLARDLPAVPLVFGGFTIAYRPAAYDGWVNVRGTGILDKRSFLRGAVAPGAGPGAAAPDLIDRSEDDFSLVPIIIGFAALMLLGGGWWLGRRR